MNLWDFFDIPSWNPVTRKLAAVVITAAALFLAYNRFSKMGGTTGGGGETATPVAPEAKTPARRQRRRRRSSAASSPNAQNAVSSVSASSVDSNTAPGISAAQSVAEPSSSKSASMETHSERAVSPSVATEPKGADQEEQLPRTSLCACRVVKKGEPIPDTEALFDASKRPVIGETSPVVDYKQLEPLRLCDPILDRKTEVTPATKRPAAVQIEQSYLTPFQSILQSLEFADKHAYLIESLVDNYEWLQ